jgi:hypothetical protein
MQILRALIVPFFSGDIIAFRFRVSVGRRFLSACPRETDVLAVRQKKFDVRRLDGLVQFAIDAHKLLLFQNRKTTHRCLDFLIATMTTLLSRLPEFPLMCLQTAEPLTITKVIQRKNTVIGTNVLVSFSGVAFFTQLMFSRCMTLNQGKTFGRPNVPSVRMLSIS